MSGMHLNTLDNNMSRRMFPIRIQDDDIFKGLDKKIKYIGGIDSDDERRTTETDYVPVTGSDGKKVIIPVIRYKLLNGYSSIIHGFSTRLGGVSTEHLSSLNLSFSRGDDYDKVIENHRRFAQAVGYDYKRLVFSDQVHDIRIHQVTLDDIGKGITRDSDIREIDGLVTNVPDIPLITFYADCVPLYFYDPVRQAVGLAHSGWKGTVNKIGTAMVEKLSELYGSRPEDIVCAIGPSICMDCYEVSADVADRFREMYTDDEYKSFILDKGNGKYQLDLHTACRYNFLHAGITNEHIAMPDMCTCCNSGLLYSHRASNGMRGNFAAVIMLK